MKAIISKPLSLLWRGMNGQLWLKEMLYDMKKMKALTHSLHQILLVVSESEHLFFLWFWHGPRM